MVKADDLTAVFCDFILDHPRKKVFLKLWTIFLKEHPEIEKLKPRAIEDMKECCQLALQLRDMLPKAFKKQWRES